MLDNPDLLDPLDHPVTKVPPEVKDTLVLKDNLEKMEKRDLQDHPVSQDWLVNPDEMETLDHLVKWGLLVPQDQLDSEDSPVLQVFQELKDIEDMLVKMEKLVFQVLPEIKVNVV